MKKASQLCDIEIFNASSIAFSLSKVLIDKPVAESIGDKESEMFKCISAMNPYLIKVSFYLDKLKLFLYYKFYRFCFQSKV